ncbi:hypothetical protein [Sphingomonas sp. Leaf4]|uniref:hypothetical protein n=1 Tax=Sphingomonas sp. Leaf4 TaxID=2876553 RepID=UPI001E2BE5F1|nr:hypothetical protein [Sphingomonas sp. Leaf4]
MPPTVELALQLLDENWRLAKDAPQQTTATRLALRVLRPHAPRQWLIDYWEACGYADPINRQANMTRCLNGIRLRIQV